MTGHTSDLSSSKSGFYEVIEIGIRLLVEPGKVIRKYNKPFLTGGNNPK